MVVVVVVAVVAVVVVAVVAAEAAAVVVAGVVGVLAVVVVCLYRSQGGPDNATGTRSASASPVALMATRILCAYQGSATSLVKGA